jgi:6-phosphogluconolactonase
MRFRWLAGCVLAAIAFLLSCGSSSKKGFVYLASQGDQSVYAYSLNLGNGVLNSSNNGLVAVGKPAATGTQPTAMVLNPEQTLGYVADYGSNDIATFSISNDGTVTSVGMTAIKAPATHPFALAMDPGGKFLFVADQGTPRDTNCTSQDPALQANCSARISVFTVDSGGGLTELNDSPFALLNLQQVSTYSVQVSPFALGVSNQGSFLYVAEHNNGILIGYSFDPSSGELSLLPSSPFTAGTAPSAVFSPPTGNFLYVGNATSNNVTAYTIDNTSGILTPVSGSPFATGEGPVAFLSDPNATYLYTVNSQSNQLFGYRLNAVTGGLSPLSPASVSTGSIPVAATIRSDGHVAGNYWVIVSNNGGNALSTFQLTTSTGALNSLPQLVSPVAPYGIASK